MKKSSALPLLMIMADTPYTITSQTDYAHIPPIPESEYIPGGKAPYYSGRRKATLTKKQNKARAKAKNGRKANRKRK